MKKDVTPEMTYFGLHAYLGTTKHMGGLATTQELIALCEVNKETTVLEVGCGVGATSCYLAKTYGCHVVGVDLRAAMIERANERARRENVAHLVEFRVADATQLPFGDERFDVVFCESVASFIEDKQRVADEFARVTKTGGAVGLNEEIWLVPPPDEVRDNVKLFWSSDLEVATVEDWNRFLVNAGLQDLLTKIYRFNARREATQLKRYRLLDAWRMFWRTLTLYIKSPDLRQYMRDRRRLPRGVFDYLGHALFVGRKG
jgi:ubiquinone/menaquinone biosynthesis C-methylase UbiE